MRRYVFGNIPLVNWLPSAIRDRLVPHARVYSRRTLDRAVAGSDLHVVARDYVFPGFDNVAARLGMPGRLLRRVMHFLEDGPLRRFGISHIYVLRKPDVSMSAVLRRPDASMSAVQRRTEAAR
jgi:hypothetical protein